MDKKTLFNNALTEFVSFAATKGNKVTINDIKSHFKGFIEDESQYQFIYDYMTVNKIEIEGFTPSNENFFETEYTASDISAQVTQDENKESKEELQFIKMYLSDMENIPSISLEEQNNWASRWGVSLRCALWR